MNRDALVIIIPCLNAAAHLRRLLPALAGLPVIVADGGSNDDSVAVATSAGARVVTAPRGRGYQLGAGAAAASAQWLLFLHADTLLSDGWREAVAGFIADPANRRRAGYFRLRFASGHPLAAVVAAGAGWRTRIFGLPYGDQGLLLSRAFYDALGGYPPLPLMEDVALVRRVGRHRLVALAADAVTSDERYRRDGWVRRPLRNLLCLSAYFLGVPPGRIARLYGR